VSFTTGDGRKLTYRKLGHGPVLVCHPGGPGFSSAYLGDLAEDTVRELLDRGVLTPARVVIPGAGGRPMRKVLFDRLALDRLADGWRTPA